MLGGEGSGGENRDEHERALCRGDRLSQRGWRSGVSAVAQRQWRVEPNEDELTTALRELHEETGLTVEIHPGFRAVLTYDFARGGAMFSKEVVYFLGRATSSEVKLSGEHVDYLWAIYARARQRLSFENTQAVLEQAENFLDRLAAS
ncbi:MAG: NUDIX domain-containing protein [Candidatus Bipolaricaulota bacterium]|nr:NUDIX domain-containing protein [Candidatus Bipolaricaulota bacterium]